MDFDSDLTGTAGGCTGCDVVGVEEARAAEAALVRLVAVVVVVFLDGVEGAGEGEAPRSFRPNAFEAALPRDEAGEPGLEVAS